jgi:hypothetical protein
MTDNVNATPTPQPANPVETENRIGCLILGYVDNRPGMVAEVLRRQAIERALQDHDYETADSLDDQREAGR